MGRRLRYRTRWIRRPRARRPCARSSRLEPAFPPCHPSRLGERYLLPRLLPPPPTHPDPRRPLLPLRRRRLRPPYLRFLSCCCHLHARHRRRLPQRRRRIRRLPPRRRCSLRRRFRTRLPSHMREPTRPRTPAVSRKTCARLVRNQQASGHSRRPRISPHQPHGTPDPDHTIRSDGTPFRESIARTAASLLGSSASPRRGRRKHRARREHLVLAPRFLRDEL